jgi:hypothetical protein
MEKMIDVESLGRLAVWLLITYGAVMVAIGIDLVTGVWKAKRAGIKCSSRGYKRTIEKAGKYFMPMLCLTCIDVIGSVAMRAPVFTMVMGAFDIFCEWKSVMESTHDKEEIREATETVKVLIKNRDDIVALVKEVLEKGE